MNFDSLQEKLSDIAMEIYILNDSIECLNTQFEEILTELNNTPNSKAKNSSKNTQRLRTHNRMRETSNKSLRNSNQIRKKEVVENDSSTK